MLYFRLNITKKGVQSHKDCTLPQSWEEVINNSLDAIGTLRTLLTQKESAAKVKILRGWLNLPKSLFNALPDEVVNSLIATLDWLKPDTLAIPFMPSFEYNKTIYHLPKANFQNGSALEFALSDDFFKKAAESDDSDALIRLTATLCRPSRTDEAAAMQAGDQRVPLVSRSEVEHRAHQLKGLDPTIQTSLFLYFAGVKHYISTLYGKHLFQETDEGDEEQETDSSANAEPFGWWGIFMEVAQSPIHLSTIHNMNFHTLCVWLVRNKILADRMRQLVTKPTFKEDDN